VLRYGGKMLEGTATAAGTARFKDRSVTERGVPATHFRMAPGGLTLSTLGLGTYLGRPDAATDLAVQDAVAVSVRSGRVNVIDTAINYRHQRAERSVGRGIAHLVEQGVAQREELFVATKAGYLAPDGESALPPDEWIQHELLDGGVLHPDDIVDGVHSMAPGYLSDQIDRSRRNLGLETIDLLYLHNAADAQLPVVGPEEFRRRLVIAFERLEEHRQSGHLQCYGLATWEVLRVPIGDPVHLDLAELVEIAKQAGGSDHGFRFVQFPFNRSMPEALERVNQPVEGETVSLFDAARRLGIGCFTSVPLLQGQLTKGAKEGAMTAAQSALQYARSAPGTIGPLVGSKTPTHLAEDLGVASFPPRTD
jgi:aryl-alcohol dehydrogenase-like predicted oxidoreductase